MNLKKLSKDIDQAFDLMDDYEDLNRGDDNTDEEQQAYDYIEAAYEILAKVNKQLKKETKWNTNFLYMYTDIHI